MSLLKKQNGRRRWRKAAKALRRDWARRWRSPAEWVHGKTWAQIVGDKYPTMRRACTGSAFRRHGVFDTGEGMRCYIGMGGVFNGEVMAFALPSPPWSPRSLVGMSMATRKRWAKRACDAVVALLEGNKADPAKLQMLRDIYRIGERLRPCPGCFECCRHMQGYGFFPGGDPRDFTPDEECSTEEERALHKADCEAWERGERPRRKTSGLEWTDAIAATNKNGKPTTIPAGYKFVSRSAYGLGSYQIGRKRSCDGSGVVPARKAVRS